MLILRYLSISNSPSQSAWTLSILVVTTLCGCASYSQRDAGAELNQGSIAYPFVDESRPLGKNNRKEKFVIRSAVGAAEYAVEIPDGGNGYDIQIPLAGMNPQVSNDALAVGAKNGKVPNPVATDKELVTALPSLAKSNPNEIATMDAALGVGSPEGPIQSPSYTMGIAKVNQYYRERNYEVALMELNNILSFYPNSPKLLKMKGTLLIKTGNHELAMRSWQRALDLAPGDANLGRAVKRLQERMVASQPQKQAPASSKDIDDSLLSPEVSPLAH